jgi:RecG-like helicase
VRALKRPSKNKNVYVVKQSRAQKRVSRLAKEALDTLKSKLPESTDKIIEEQRKSRKTAESKSKSHRKPASKHPLKTK